MTESNQISQDKFDGKLPQLAVDFLRFIKLNHDEGKSLYIKDFKDYFQYDNHQMISKYLDKLEVKRFIERDWKNGKRVIDITNRGLEYIYALGYSFFSGFERMQIQNLRKEGGIEASKETVSLIISEFTKKYPPNQDDRVKDAILRELGREIVPESSLNNICKKFRQIRLESGRDFIENYESKDPST